MTWRCWAGGIAVFAADRDDGYFTSDRHRLESATYAIASEDIDLGVDELDWAPDGLLGDVRVHVDGDKATFVGIGRDSDVDRYLGDVVHDELVGFDGDDAQFDRPQGSARATSPGGQNFWVAKAEGSGEQELTWDAEFGPWSVVLMNADPARGIDFEADTGVKLGWAIWAGLGMLLVGLLTTVGAVAVIVLIGRRPAATRRPAV
ncbi:MAG: hypothetical protein ACRDK0_08005 [Solirubrobacteraceae bacterium]